MKKIGWYIIRILIIALIIYLIIKPKLGSNKIEYTYTLLEKGTIESVVSSTGSLKAINTVEIGTQISGTIKKIYVDYNDKVKAGQLLAEMDLKLLNTNLISAKANLAVNEAKYNQAMEEYERNKALFNDKIISQKEFITSKYNFNQAESAKEVALAALNNIKVSINYAHITSPINGTVTERSVEEGQTVAAAFSTPKMFIVAEDLSKMQILADVDESDIGYINNGLQVRFKVQTYNNIDFFGTVSQIRLQPIEINNVVNYQVVINVNNEEGLLLPGMTTNIEFITNTAENVVLINNSALRFRPNEQMLNEIKQPLLKKVETIFSDTLQNNFKNIINNEAFYTPTNFKKSFPKNIDGFFYLNQKGKLDFKFFEKGIRTGLQSEIKKFMDGSELSTNIKAINGIKSKS